MINCEFDYCIYNKDSHCLLKSVSISSCGMCANCIMPNFDTAALGNFKKATLIQLNPRLLIEEKSLD